MRLFDQTISQTKGFPVCDDQIALTTTTPPPPVISGSEMVTPSDVSALLSGIMILNILIKVFKIQCIVLLQIMRLRKLQ
jgi:hypothetical protein